MRDLVDWMAALAIALSLLGGSSCTSGNETSGPPDASLTDGPVLNHTVTVDVFDSNNLFLRKAPAWIVVQDGDGAFQTLGGEPPYAITINDSAGRFGVAIGCIDGYYPITLYQGTLSDGNSIQLVCLTGQTVTHSVTIGSVHASDAHPGCTIGYGFVSALLCSSGDAVDVTTGPHDVIGFYDDGASTVRAYVRRNVDEDAVTVDFTDPQNSAASSRHRLLGASDWQFSVGYVTPSTRAFQFGATYVAMPASFRDAADRYEARIGTRMRQYATLLFVEPRDIDARSWSFANLPSPNAAFSARYVTWHQDPQAVGIRFTVGGDEFALGAWDIYVSRATLNGATQYTVPDLSSVEGFRSEWDLLTDRRRLEVYYPLLSPTTFGVIASLFGPAIADEVDFANVLEIGSSALPDAGMADAP